MARVRIKPTGTLEAVAKGPLVAAQLQAIAAPIFSAAQRDSNEAYVASLQMRQFVSGGKRGRVSIQIGAHPVIGSRVEAKRGTLARAMGAAGL